MFRLQNWKTLASDPIHSLLPAPPVTLDSMIVAQIGNWTFFLQNFQVLPLQNLEVLVTKLANGSMSRQNVSQIAAAVFCCILACTASRCTACTASIASTATDPAPYY